jgi:hypothetical protein
MEGEKGGERGHKRVQKLCRSGARETKKREAAEEISMNEPSQQSLRQEHDALQMRLSTRVSTTHFAHGAVSAVLTIVFGGAALRLKDDLPVGFEVLWMAMGGCAAIFAGYSLTRLLLGRSRLRVERVHFEKLKSLREQLKLDQPAQWTSLP